MEKKLTAWARVRITIEVNAGSAWGANCTVQQILDQAGRETVARIEQLLSRATDVRLIGAPIVTAIMAQETTDGQ